MSAPTHGIDSTVTADEVKRRIAEYRRLGFQRQAPAHVVYREEHQSCPWAGCDLQIVGINFQLDALGDAAQRAAWLAAWWNGPGLVGRCPRCGRHVLFTLADKRAVPDPHTWGLAVLPDNWHEKAHVVTKSA